MEDDLNFLVNGRPPKFKKQTMQHQTNKTDFYTTLMKSTSQLLPGNLTNTTTKNILHNLKKSTLIGCNIIVN